MDKIKNIAIYAYNNLDDGDISEKTISDYYKKSERINIKANGDFVEYTNKYLKTKQSFYAYKAAYKYYNSKKILEKYDTLKKIRKNTILYNNIRHDLFQNYENLKQVMQSYTVYYTKKNGGKKYSVRKSLRYLPIDWREKVLNKMPSKYFIPCLVLASTGCRPSELNEAKIFIENKVIKCLIKGTKVNHEKSQGQEYRYFEINPFSGVYKFVYDLIQKENLTLKISNDLNINSLRNVIKRAGIRALGERRGKKINPYCFRHQFASDMKLKKYDMSTIAKVLGHSVTRTQQLYGHIKQGRSTGFGLHNIRTTNEIKVTHSNFMNNYKSEFPSKKM